MKTINSSLRDVVLFSTELYFFIYTFDHQNNFNDAVLKLQKDLYHVSSFRGICTLKLAEQLNTVKSIWFSIFSSVGSACFLFFEIFLKSEYVYTDQNVDFEDKSLKTVTYDIHVFYPSISPNNGLKKKKDLPLMLLY